jgi:hypothetical protein
MTDKQPFDNLLAAAIGQAGAALTQQAIEIGAEAIRERKHMQPAMKSALIEQLGAEVVTSERRLPFGHWQGAPGKRLGGVDLATTNPDGSWQALIELKWCPLDGLYLGWAIWDFYKMATGRISPGTDACYIVAGAPDTLWAKPGTVGEVFQTSKWNIPELYLRHEKIWVGEGNDCKKLTVLPHEIDTTLAADHHLTDVLKGWTIKAVRVEPHADTANWLALRDGRLNPG